MPTVAEVDKNLKELKKHFEGFSQSVLTTLNELKASFLEVKNSQLNLANEVKLALVNELNASFKTQIDIAVEPINKQLEAAFTKINTLESQILKITNRHEVDARQNNIVISGIPARPNENLQELVSNLSSKLGYESPPAFHSKRISTGNSNSIILVKFLSALDKLNFMGRYFRKANLLLSDAFGGTGSSSRIYFNHDLTKKNYEIQKLALSLRKSKKIYQVRVFHGSIGIKVKPDDFRFEFINDIESLQHFTMD